MRITIQGYSDDIVSVEGDLNEEFSALRYDDTEGFLGLSDGTSIKYRYDGIWRFTILNHGVNSIVNLIQCSEDNEDVYSDLVVIESKSNIKWIIHGPDRLGAG
jgi:hypothetical protein